MRTYAARVQRGRYESKTEEEGRKTLEDMRSGTLVFVLYSGGALYGEVELETFRNNSAN